ncbi:hypothetical protein F4782DRAFT_527156 [Xylaria castorea]|nr:hypothetical protein F4782DRAFT_527156 [Xylaria castorea]
MSKVVLPIRGALSTDQHPEPNPAWFWSGDSAAHACMDRTLFKEYTKFVSKVLCSSLNGYYELSVLGIGTVELGIKNKPSLSDKAPQNILRLVDVLHVPHLPFNVIAAKPDIGDWASPRANSYIYDNDRSLIAYFPVNGIELAGEPGDSVRSLLELSEQSGVSLIEPCCGPDRPVGSVAAPSDCPAGRAIALSDHPSYSGGKQIISWQTLEQLRWRTYKCMRQESAMPTHSPTRIDTACAHNPLKRVRGKRDTENGARFNSTKLNEPKVAQHAENSCKKVKFNDDIGVEPPPHSGSELEYIKVNGLKLVDVEHRNGERRKAGAILSHDPDEEDEEGTLVEDMEYRSTPDASRRSPQFSIDHLRWINKHWGNVGIFMDALQLDIRKEADWDTAESIMKSCVLPPKTPDSKSGKNSVPQLSKNSADGKNGKNGMNGGNSGNSGNGMNGVNGVNGVMKSSSRLSVGKETTDSGSGSSAESEEIDLVSQTCAEMERMNSISQSIVE